MISFTRKTARKGRGKGCILNGEVSVSPTKKVTFEQSLEGRKRISDVDIWEKEEQVVQRSWGHFVLPSSQKGQEMGVPEPECP